jgi:stage III sporulation protein SpoIIIAA
MLDELQMNVSKRTLLRALARLKKSGALKFFPKTKTVIVKEFV